MKRKVTIAVVVVVLSFVVIMATNKVSSISKDVSKNDNELTFKEKLALLGNINEKINYFNNNYIDRYISYKNKHQDKNNQLIVLEVNIGLDQEFYTNIKKSNNLDTTYILVNKYNYLEEDYVPSNLETIDSKYSLGEKKLVNLARISFEFLAKRAKEEGYNIRAVSTYRSYSYQTNLYNNYVDKDGVSLADQYSARPGFSEHQTGLAVDVDNISKDFNNFESTEEFKWMQDNSYKYGFILRYPKDKEYITGYTYEPWHYRYVGVQIASLIHKENITYEEYYVKYINK